MQKIELRSIVILPSHPIWKFSGDLGFVLSGRNAEMVLIANSRFKNQNNRVRFRLVNLNSCQFSHYVNPSYTLKDNNFSSYTHPVKGCVRCSVTREVPAY